MRVLLISPNRETRFGAITPLGVACVAAAARSAGHAVQILDLCFEDDAVTAIRDQVGAWAPDLIGVSVRNLDNTLCLAPVSYVPQLKTIVDICRACSDAQIILGGAGFSLMPEAVLRICNLTLGIVGEGEDAFPQLLSALERESDFRSVPGLAYLAENRYHQNAPARVADLDSLPRPARDLFDERYRLQQDPSAIGNIEAKRGCRFQCLYCTYPLIQGRTIRLRSPDKVAEEMCELKTSSGLTRVDFVDNVFNDPLDHALAVCRAILRRKVALPWGCSMRPDQVSSELVEAMVQAGCQWVELGADAVSRRMLDVLAKGFDVDALRHSRDLLKAVGIETAVYVLIGGPGENRQTLQETLANLEKLNPSWVYLMPGLRVFPGTPLHHMVCESMNEALDWLKPTFYLSPGLGDDPCETLFQWSRAHENWIVLGSHSAQGRRGPQPTGLFVDNGASPDS